MGYTGGYGEGGMGGSGMKDGSTSSKVLIGT